MRASGACRDYEIYLEREEDAGETPGDRQAAKDVSERRGQTSNDAPKKHRQTKRVRRRIRTERAVRGTERLGNVCNVAVCPAQRRKTPSRAPRSFARTDGRAVTIRFHSCGIVLVLAYVDVATEMVPHFPFAFPPFFFFFAAAAAAAASSSSLWILSRSSSAAFISSNSAVAPPPPSPARVSSTSSAPHRPPSRASIADLCGDGRRRRARLIRVPSLDVPPRPRARRCHRAGRFDFATRTRLLPRCLLHRFHHIPRRLVRRGAQRGDLIVLLTSANELLSPAASSPPRRGPRCTPCEAACWRDHRGDDLRRRRRGGRRRRRCHRGNTLPGRRSAALARWRIRVCEVVARRSATACARDAAAARSGVAPVGSRASTSTPATSVAQRDARSDLGRPWTRCASRRSWPGPPRGDEGGTRPSRPGRTRPRRRHRAFPRRGGPPAPPRADGLFRRGSSAGLSVVGRGRSRSGQPRGTGGETRSRGGDAYIRARGRRGRRGRTVAVPERARDDTRRGIPSRTCVGRGHRVARGYGRPATRAASSARTGKAHSGASQIVEIENRRNFRGSG